MTGLFRELQRLGCKISGSTHAGERFSVGVGSCWTYINFVVVSEATPQFGRSPGPRLESLRFAITDHDADRGKPKQFWTEAEAKLETWADDIARGLLLQVEADARIDAIRRHDWAVEDRERRRREAVLAVERAEAARIAQEQAAKEARLKALTDGADALETAARVRRYVAAAKELYRSENVEKLDHWATWALQAADELDPLVSGQFLLDFGSG